MEEKINKSIRDRWFSKIDNEQQALNLLKESKWGGWIFFGMYLLGLFLPMLAVPDITQDELLYTRIGIAIVALWIGFMTWRVQTGKGLISAACLLLLFLFEIAGKFQNGTAGIFWFPFYLVLVICFVNNFRSIRFLKRVAAARNEKGVISAVERTKV